MAANVANCASYPASSAALMFGFCAIILLINCVAVAACCGVNPAGGEKVEAELTEVVARPDALFPDNPDEESVE